MPILLLAVLISCFSMYSTGAVTNNVQNEQEVDMRNQFLKESLSHTFSMDLKTMEDKDQFFASVASDLKSCPYGDSLISRFKSNFMDSCDKLIDGAEAKGISLFLMKDIVEGDQLMKNERKEFLQAFLLEKAGEKGEEKKRIEELGELSGLLTSNFKSCIYKTKAELPNGFYCKALIETARNEGLSYFEVKYFVQKSIAELKQLLEQSDNNDKDKSAAQETTPKQVSKP